MHECQISIEIQTAGRNLAQAWFLRAGRFWGRGRPGTPHPRGYGRTWTPCASGAVVTHFQGEFIKSMSQCMFQIGTSSQQGMAEGTGHWAGGPWKANVWLSQHTFLIRLNLIISIFFLKTSFESSRATLRNHSQPLSNFKTVYNLMISIFVICQQISSAAFIIDT